MATHNIIALVEGFFRALQVHLLDGFINLFGQRDFRAPLQLA